jgi:hypothetical protein
MEREHGVNFRFRGKPVFDLMLNTGSTQLRASVSGQSDQFFAVFPICRRVSVDCSLQLVNHDLCRRLFGLRAECGGNPNNRPVARQGPYGSVRSWRLLSRQRVESGHDVEEFFVD